MIAIYITLFFILGSLLWRALCYFYNIPWPAILAFWLENPYMKIFANPTDLISKIPTYENPRVLELGVGAGRVLIRLSKSLQGIGSFIGIDLQEKMISHATKKALSEDAEIKDSLYFKKLDLTNSEDYNSIKDEIGYDLILLITVLGEIPEKTKTLETAKNLLAPGGTIVIQEVLPDPCYITSGNLRKIAKTAGLKHEKTYKNLLNYISLFKAADQHV
jgi:ubiquinone/menaquinone biosynthesis C-methylase UbiE